MKTEVLSDVFIINKLSAAMKFSIFCNKKGHFSNILKSDNILRVSKKRWFDVKVVYNINEAENTEEIISTIKVLRVFLELNRIEYITKE